MTGKQCRPWSDAAFCDIWSEASLFAQACPSQYRNNPKYWGRLAFANSVDPDQMLQNAASDQGLHYLPYIEQSLRTPRGSRMDYFKF